MIRVTVRRIVAAKLLGWTIKATPKSDGKVVMALVNAAVAMLETARKEMQ